jgi:hypothetical protein
MTGKEIKWWTEVVAILVGFALLTAANAYFTLYLYRPDILGMIFFVIIEYCLVERANAIEKYEYARYWSN